MKFLPRHFAALIALLLLAAQSATLSHAHAADMLHGRAAVCDLCAGLQSSAPPPELAAISPHAAAQRCVTVADDLQPLPVRAPSSHRSRAPPAFRSA